MSTTQLRVYTIRPGRLDEWIGLFHGRIVPLRRELGFAITHSWVDREHGQHLWVVTYEGRGTFEEANRRYWRSPRRTELDVDPADFLLAEETHWIEPASPNGAFRGVIGDG